MPYMLPSVADLVPDKGPVLALAAKLLPTVEMAKQPAATDLRLERAKRAAYRAYHETVRTGLFGGIRDTLQRVVDLQEVMDSAREDADDATAWDAALDTSVANELQSVRAIAAEAFDSFAQSVAMHEVGRVDEAADHLAGLVANAAPYHFADADYGKALSAAGIVADDLQGLAVLVSDEMLNSPASLTVAPHIFETEGAEGAGLHVVEPPVVEPPVVVTEPEPPTVDMRPPPNGAEIAKAYRLMYEAAGVDSATVATELGVSRNTLLNWCTGKAKPKCTAEQGRYLQTICEKMATDMQAAAATFSRIR